VPFLAAYLIEPFGWRGAMFALGCGTVAILLPLAIGMGQAPAVATAPRGEAQFSPAMTVPILAGAVFFCCICMAVPLMHLMPLIQSFCIPSTDAGSVMFAMLIAAIGGRIACGKLCDLIGALRSWLVASALQTIGVLAFTQFASLQGFMLFSIVYGFAYPCGRSRGSVRKIVLNGQLFGEARRWIIPRRCLRGKGLTRSISASRCRPGCWRN
jgi:predicted MFS family arabinose efflux permease